MNERYFTESGYDPEIKGAFTTAGPQAADQILREIRDLLSRPGITEVVILFDHGQGLRLETFRKMKE